MGLDTSGVDEVLLLLLLEELVEEVDAEVEEADECRSAGEMVAVDWKRLFARDFHTAVLSSAEEGLGVIDNERIPNPTDVVVLSVEKAERWTIVGDRIETGAEAASLNPNLGIIRAAMSAQKMSCVLVI